MACYVYGVTMTGFEPPADLRGLDAQPVTAVRGSRCAALVSGFEADRPLGTRADLLAHQRVLESVVAAGSPVLPFRFGAALADLESVADTLLARNAQHFSEELNHLRGHVQLTLKGRYNEEAVVRELLREHPSIAELGEELRRLPQDVTYYERVRLGETIAGLLTERAAADAHYALDRLAPHAARTVAHPPNRADEVLDAAFLVRRDHLDEFERIADDLGEHWRGLIGLRLLGPLPPYDFIASQGRSWD